MPTNPPPATREATDAPRPVVAARSPLPTRLQLPGGYYDPDSAAFDDVRPVDLDALVKATAEIPAAGLARARS
jgi:hypothetical protein